MKKNVIAFLFSTVTTFAFGQTQALDVINTTQCDVKVVANAFNLNTCQMDEIDDVMILASSTHLFPSLGGAWVYQNVTMKPMNSMNTNAVINPLYNGHLFPNCENIPIAMPTPSMTGMTGPCASGAQLVLNGSGTMATVTIFP